MASPKSAQFFQFDSKGNMYVYAPDAGCSGDAKLMAPGDELIFSNNTQWEQRDASLLSQASTSPQDAFASTYLVNEASRPFNMPLPQNALTELSHKNF